MVLEDTPKPGAAPTDDYMKIAQLRFAASQKVAGAADELKKVITARKMTPLYIAVCEQLGWKSDAALLSSMKADNATALEALDAKIKESEEQEGETEIREAFLAGGAPHRDRREGRRVRGDRGDVQEDGRDGFAPRPRPLEAPRRFIL